MTNSFLASRSSKNMSGRNETRYTVRAGNRFIPTGEFSMPQLYLPPSQLSPPESSQAHCPTPSGLGAIRLLSIRELRILITRTQTKRVAARMNFPPCRLTSTCAQDRSLLDSAEPGPLPSAQHAEDGQFESIARSHKNCRTTSPPATSTTVLLHLSG